MIKLDNLSVTLGNFSLKDIDIAIDKGEYFIILGPTGAGKTVLLESIVGLNPVHKGKVYLDDRDITDWGPEKRGIGIVYQDHALFPHLSVKDNVLFGLRLKKKTKKELQETLDWLGELLGITPLLERKTGALSGGERQKVALARALSIRPEVLLLDEPLASLDPETRENVQEELLTIHASLNNTIIHVTHDFEEAMILGHRVAVIGDGCLKQVGTPDDIFRHPDSEFVARFVMARNIFPGTATKGNDRHTVFRTGDKEFVSTSVLEGNCHAIIRPENIDISRQKPSDSINCFTATITRLTRKGWTVVLILEAPPRFECFIPYRYMEETGFEVGQKVYVSFFPGSVHLFPE